MGRQNKSRNKGKYRTVSYPAQSLLPVPTVNDSDADEVKENNPLQTPMKLKSRGADPDFSAATPIVKISRSTPNSIHSAARLTSSATPNASSSYTPRSVPVSGHVWRDPGSATRTSALHRNPHVGLKSKSLTARNEQRKAREAIKEKEKSLKEAAKLYRDTERLKLEQRKKQKELNEKNSQIVQVIKDTSKIKKMTPRQKKLLQKM